jgi:solute carrier family 3 protein 2
MTKDELMKYANDPFWIKLRWILFIAFWALWVAMLAGAIAIIVLAPKCAAPEPLKFYQKGPLVTIKDANDGDVDKMKELEVQGVIYELPAEETYLVGKVEVIGDKIKKIVDKYNAKGIEVILDLTPNFVTQSDELFKSAKDAEEGSDFLAPFATTKKTDSNWLKVGANNTEKAFEKIGKHIFLSQFGNNIDVRLDNSLVQEKFKNVLTTLVELGVKGFRLKNAKYFKIGDTDKNEEHSHVVGATQNQYEFFNHKETTFQPGLGDLILDYTNFVHNITNDEGFLTVTNSFTGHEDKMLTSRNTIAFDLPKLAIIKELVSTQSSSAVATKVSNIIRAQEQIYSVNNIWMQLPFTANSYDNIDPSAFYMFISLMRGVLIAPQDAFDKISKHKFDLLKEERKKDAVQFGKFEVLVSADNTTIGYTR